MKAIFNLGAILLLTHGLGASAGEPVSVSKAKAGILSTSEVYRIYSVTCSNEIETAIASLGSSRWCFARGSDLDCAKSRDSAAHKACAATDLVYLEGALAATSE